MDTVTAGQIGQATFRALPRENPLDMPVQPLGRKPPRHGPLPSRPPYLFLRRFFVLAATAMVHDFWRQTGQQRETDLGVAIANLIMVGGLLGLAAATL